MKYIVFVPVLCTVPYETEAASPQEAKATISMQVALGGVSAEAIAEATDEVQYDSVWCAEEKSGVITYPPGDRSAGTDAERELGTAYELSMAKTIRTYQQIAKVVLNEQWDALRLWARDIDQLPPS